MASKKIAINGFGRIGRLAARIIFSTYPELEIVAVNDLTSAENLAYLLQYDSTYRQFEYQVSVDNGEIVVANAQQTKRIKVFSEKDPSKLPWKDLGVEQVLECTGRFLTPELAHSHIVAGAQKVVLSAPAKDESIQTVVLGVNARKDDTSALQAEIISNASCTTNCIAPALKVLEDSFGIEQAFGITVHAYTATQLLQDGPSQKEFRDGRAAAINMIPSRTGAAKAVYRVLPGLTGKLNLSAIRVPVVTGSMVYLTASLRSDKKHVTLDSLTKEFIQASLGNMKGILQYSTADLVSSDIIQNPNSCVVDGSLTELLGQTVKMVLWYDNEWGYANRLVEVCALS